MSGRSGWNDRAKPGKGIDDNKGVGYQTQNVDRAALKKMYGNIPLPTKTGDEATS